MTEKEFIRNLMISNIFYHPIYGRVQISCLPNSNGEINAFSLDYIKPVNIKITDLKNNSFGKKYTDASNDYFIK